MSYTSYSHYLATEDQTLALARQLAGVMPAEVILFLYGRLGAGKTTFARGFLRGLGYQGKVKSPTYTLVESYDVAGHQVLHFDLYRLQHAQELEYIGIHEYFSKPALCLIEWPEKGLALLPKPDVVCYLTQQGEGRELKLVAETERGDVILRALSNKN